MEDRRWSLLAPSSSPLASISYLPSSVIKSLISDLITALRQSQRLLCLRRQRAGHAQALIALIAHQRVARFRSENAIDLSVVVTCSRQFILQVRHHRGGGFILRTGAIGALIVVLRLIVVIVSALAVVIRLSV